MPVEHVLVVKQASQKATVKILNRTAKVLVTQLSIADVESHGLCQIAKEAQ